MTDREKLPLPGARPCCGRSVLTHVFAFEVGLANSHGRGHVRGLVLNGSTTSCGKCGLTDARRKNRQAFEVWMDRCVRKFKEQEGLLEPEPAPPPANLLEIRHNDEFEAVIRTRMRHARKCRKIKQGQFAAAIGYKLDTYNRWERNTRFRKDHPDSPALRLRAFALVRAAGLLGCSVDWLCGLTDDPGWKSPELDPALGFQEYLREEMKRSGA